MTRERIEDMREVVLPFVKKRLLEINYENLGESDAEEFAMEFNEILDLAIEALEQEPTTKHDLGVDCIDRVELLKAMDTWDKFGNDPNEGLIPLRTPALRDRYVPYVKYDDMVNCVKGMSSVTSQEPKTGHWILGVCDNCGYDWSKNAPIASVPNFCPNCGADMREVEE